MPRFHVMLILFLMACYLISTSAYVNIQDLCGEIYLLEHVGPIDKISCLHCASLLPTVLCACDAMSS
jgi:hypothetical protein